MSPYPLVPGLRFNDCLFSEPVRLANWAPPQGAGIVAVLTHDFNWAPKPFQVLYFGEFGHDARGAIETRGLPAGLSGDLYVATMLMPFSTSGQRLALRNELIAAYNPACQGQGGMTARELAGRLEAMEARQQEQHAQILSLLAHLAKFFEPQTVGPRRPIGFWPAAAPAE